MTQLILTLVPLPLVGFWMWMFRDMLNNEHLPREERSNWTLAFVFLSIVAAIQYYFQEYRPRK